jgi:hypothetical protein
MGALKLVLSQRGRLHLEGRCRASGHSFELQPYEELIGFLYLAFNGLCRNCFREARS